MRLKLFECTLNLMFVIFKHIYSCLVISLILFLSPFSCWWSYVASVRSIIMVNSSPITIVFVVIQSATVYCLIMSFISIVHIIPVESLPLILITLSIIVWIPVSTSSVMLIIIIRISPVVSVVPLVMSISSRCKRTSITAYISIRYSSINSFC